MGLRNLLLSALALSRVSATDLAEGSSWEWAGTFETPDAAYNWIAEKMVCHYADAHMKIVVLSVADGTEASLKALEAVAESTLASTCEEVESGETLTQSSTKCYELHFDASSAVSTFTLAPNGAAHVAIFTAHSPFEFESTQHFFQSTAGADVEPEATITLPAGPCDEEADDPHAGHNHGRRRLSECADDPHAGHNHGRRLSKSRKLAGGHTEAYEWAGTFATPSQELDVGSNYYYWSAEKVNGDYADATMKLILLPATATDEDSLEGYESTADTLLDGTCTGVTNGAVLTPSTTTCYLLQFDCSMTSTIWKIDVTGVANVAIFTEHSPLEFERDAHFFKDTKGADVEPIATLPHAEVAVVAAVAKPWGKSIGAAIIVNLCTLLGVVLLIPAFGKWAKANPNIFGACMNAFAAGAIISCAFFLLLFEATHLIPFTTEGETTARWASMVLTGFLTPMVLQILVGLATREDKGVVDSVPSSKMSSTSHTEAVSPPPSPPSSSTALAAAEEAIVIPSPPPSPPADGASLTHRVRVLAGVLLGDFMHNFVDGIFIGGAFMRCNDAKGWKVTYATVAHELAQEIGDFVVLTDKKQGGLKPIAALGLNFLSGISVCIGVIVVLAADVNYYSQGMLLAYGGGVYVHIAATECMSHVYSYSGDVKALIMSFGFFCIGCIAIGLVLLDHEHC